MLEKSTAGGLDGWARNEIKALPLPWFSGLAMVFCLRVFWMPILP